MYEIQDIISMNVNDSQVHQLQKQVQQQQQQQQHEQQQEQFFNNETTTTSAPSAAASAAQYEIPLSRLVMGDVIHVGTYGPIFKGELLQQQEQEQSNNSILISVNIPIAIHTLNFNSDETIKHFKNYLLPNYVYVHRHFH